ncbi:galaxin-like [Lingula anatina]|uniref:Galaxin-like n=1 Tax=Lingula anatina TaxID=7574 RepID=A0A1S3I7R8_LINAN|nr:galaxin-like [Lingula anatina]XP_013394303.1 galaxin-like [Lingula anatina]|eukprot:XP_013394302.1 galaxin-like [Lingula anatina]
MPPPDVVHLLESSTIVPLRFVTGSVEKSSLKHHQPRQLYAIELCMIQTIRFVAGGKLLNYSESSGQYGCCGNTVYDINTQLCCNSEQSYSPSIQLCCNDGVREGSSNTYGCCGKGLYRLRNEVCCNGKNHRLRSRRHKECCGREAFNPGYTKKCCHLENGSSRVYNSRRKSCCGGKLINGQLGCCGNNFFNKSNAVCCGNRVLSTNQPDIMDCCLDPENGIARLYNIYTQSCCRGHLHSRGFQQCGDSCFDPSQATCCRGVLHPGQGQGYDCCGTQLYNNTVDLCCMFVVHKNAKLQKSICSGRNIVESPRNRGSTESEHQDCPTRHADRQSLKKAFLSSSVVLQGKVAKRYSVPFSAVILKNVQMLFWMGHNSKPQLKKRIKVVTKDTCNCSTTLEPLKQKVLLIKKSNMSDFSTIFLGGKDFLLRRDQNVKRMIEWYKIKNAKKEIL